MKISDFMLDKSTIETLKKFLQSLLIVYKFDVPAYVLYYYLFYAEAGIYVIFFFLILSKKELPVSKISFVSPPVPPWHSFRAICKN